MIHTRYTFIIFGLQTGINHIFGMNEALKIHNLVSELEKCRITKTKIKEELAKLPTVSKFRTVELAVKDQNNRETPTTHTKWKKKEKKETKKMSSTHKTHSSWLSVRFGLVKGITLYDTRIHKPYLSENQRKQWSEITAENTTMYAVVWMSKWKNLLKNASHTRISR